MNSEDCSNVAPPVQDCLNKPKTYLTAKPKKWLFVIPIILAVCVAVFLNRNSKTLESAPIQEVARTLRIIEVEKLDVTPRAVGYGLSMPGEVWQAVSEVKGRLVKVHPELASGAILKKGTILLEIDKRDYQLAVQFHKAALNQIQAQIAELEAQEVNTKASLKIEQRSLLLAEETLVRKQNLLSKKAISVNQVDAEERHVLVQRQNVRSLENSLSLIPSKKQSLQARLKSSQSQLEQAKLDLKRVVIIAPFDCRLGQVNLDRDQFVAAGQVLFEAYCMKVTEVEARFQPSKLGALFKRDLPYEALKNHDMNEIRQAFNVSAEVRVRYSNKPPVTWPARFDRIREALDPQTRTFGIVVAVDNPYKNIIPGQKPALTKDVFCEVELKASYSIKAIAIPYSALHGDTVYIVDKDNRLQKRKVSTGFLQKDFITINEGLQEGDTLIVSDPIPAINGMLVDPVYDDQLTNRLKLQAQGKGYFK